MTETFPRTVTGYLPLAIDKASWSQPVLTLSGESWSLSVTCPWRLRADGDFLDAAGSGLPLGESERGSDLEKHVAALVGREIIAVSAADDDLLDPAFRISGGFVIELFADTDLDPWVMRLAKHTFVGIASHA